MILLIIKSYRKLEYCGIRGVRNDWFKSYLSNRKQFVSINDYNIDLNSLNCGVPQSSVLGPLFFLIYINDLLKELKNLKSSITFLIIKISFVSQWKIYISWSTVIWNSRVIGWEQIKFHLMLKKETSSF